MTLDDAFWAPRIETNRTASIPTALQQCELTGRVGNFRRAAQMLKGEPLADTKAPGYPFDDSDLYKVIEGASYALSVHPDAKLDAYVDQLIATIAAAQEPDGYLYTTRTINPAAPHPWAGKVRWEFERDDSHELYDLGHLFEAAAAHYQSTGKRTLLDVAVRSADLLDRTFGPGKASIWPGHQVTEMGLVRLYRVTGNERYLALAKFLIDERGPTSGAKTNGLGLEYNQAQVRAVEQTEPVGHAVRAMYMYAGMADVAALTGDVAYVQALEKIWTNTVGGKLYLTGGIGSTGAGEAFGKPYELPNMTAYNETCASVGMDYWNHRLFLLHGDGRYIDVLERTLYNALLSGVALDGKTYFYPNPLESAGQHQRSPWFGVACCPGNITRFLASLPGYVYAHQGDAVYVNLYAAGTATIDTGAGHRVRLRQQTRYPWDGVVTLTVTPRRHARSRSACVSRDGHARRPCRATCIASRAQPRRRCRCRSTACRVPSTSTRATRSCRARGRPATRSRWICRCPLVASGRIRRSRPTGPRRRPARPHRLRGRVARQRRTTCATSCCQTRRCSPASSGRRCSGACRW